MTACIDCMYPNRVYGFIQLVEKEIDGKKILFKHCMECRKTKPLNDFPADKQALGGVGMKCNTCRKKTRRLWWKRNREKLLERHRHYIKENPEIKRAAHHRRRAMKRHLPFNWTAEDERRVRGRFNGSCALTGFTKNVHLDHFIALDTGHGGSYVGNIVPIYGPLNLHKNDRNPFEWVEEFGEELEIDMDAWNDLITWMAQLNSLTAKQFRDFVHWCYANPRTVEQVKADPRKSIEIWVSHLKKGKSL